MWRTPPFTCRQGLVVVLAALALFWLALCQPAPVAAAPGAKRIVSLAPSATEMLFALGLGDRVVGVSDLCNYPPEATRKPRVGGVQVAEERVMALRPDLIVATEGDPARLARLGKLTGARVETLRTRRLSDVWAGLRTLGRQAAVEPAAEKLVKRLQSQVADYAAKAAQRKARPTVFYMVWDAPLMTAGQDSYLSELITLAGGRNLVGAMPGGSYPGYSYELLLAKNPDVVLGPTHLAPALKTLAQRYPRLKAVKAARVRTLPDDLVSRPGPRVVQGLEAIERALR